MKDFHEILNFLFPSIILITRHFLRPKPSFQAAAQGARHIYDTKDRGQRPSEEFP